MDQSTIGMGNGVVWITNYADMVYTTFATSTTQYLAYVQSVAEHDDLFVVEIVTPFTKSLPGSITLDIGTVGDPTAYVSGFDLTQSAGTYSFGGPFTPLAGLPSLTATTDIKARVTYVAGSLTAGEFLLHVRAGLLKTS